MPLPTVLPPRVPYVGVSFVAPGGEPGGMGVPVELYTGAAAQELLDELRVVGEIGFAADQTLPVRPWIPGRPADIGPMATCGATKKPETPGTFGVVATTTVEYSGYCDSRVALDQRTAAILALPPEWWAVEVVRLAESTVATVDDDCVTVLDTSVPVGPVIWTNECVGSDAKSCNRWVQTEHVSTTFAVNIHLTAIGDPTVQVTAQHDARTNLWYWLIEREIAVWLSDLRRP